MRKRFSTHVMSLPALRARQGRKLASSLAATSDRLRGRAEEQVRKVLSPSGKAGADVKGAAAAHKQA